MGCKRVLLSNNYYPTFNLPQVRLETESIECLDTNGIVTADGHHHEVDVVIYGTGFRATDFLTPMLVCGRGGVELNSTWKHGAEAYLGTCAQDCPNFFMLYGPKTNLGHNSIIYMLESQLSYVLSALEYTEQQGLTTLKVKTEVQEAFNRSLQEKLHNTVWEQGCHNWYATAEGKNTNNWPDFNWIYRQQTRQLKPEDYIFGKTGKPQQRECLKNRAYGNGELSYVENSRRDLLRFSIKAFVQPTISRYCPIKLQRALHGCCQRLTARPGMCHFIR